MASRPKDMWKPIRNGASFCSPACGGNCTRAAFDSATSSAKALAERLGAGWHPEVWENLGWHYKAVNASGVLVVMPSDGRKRWTAYLGEHGYGRWSESGTTPMAAVRNVRRVAEAERDAITMLLGASHDH
jgi:hypothetical protein